MNINRVILVICLCLCFLPKKAFMSGNVSRAGVSEFVYVEISTGLKFQRGSREMQEVAHKENEYRLERIQKEADSLANKIQLTIGDSVKSWQDTFYFDTIEEDYELFEKYMTGYRRFPTLSTDEELQEHVGKQCYVLMHEDPIVVINFAKLPEKEQLDLIRKVIMMVLDEQP